MKDVVKGRGQFSNLLSFVALEVTSFWYEFWSDERQMSMVCTAKSTYIPELDTRTPPIVFQSVSITTLGSLDANRITVTDDEEPVDA